MDLKRINTTVLAYLGDSVYEVYVRTRVVEQAPYRADKLHKMAVKYVKASAQAKAIKLIFEELTQEEQALVRRARNHKIATKAKNATVMDYKWATAFESLIGYLYLAENIERMEKLINKAMEVIDE